MKSFYYFLIVLVVGIFSCTDSRKMTYNESLSLPINSEFADFGFTVRGYFQSSKLTDALNIPSDARVEKFSIVGFSLLVEPQIGNEADWIRYALDFNCGEPVACRLLENQLRFVGGGEKFNLTSELNGKHLTRLRCQLEYMVSEGRLGQQCISGDIEYQFQLKTFDAFSNSKKFVGKVTGFLNVQVSYSVCEDFPKGLFSDFQKCDD
ncbi:MAG: hypothetical protein IPO72_06540 [Saprospiraceae bacterium]|nr:hypothetical protein [Candidatus Vicinibacter affinis]